MASTIRRSHPDIEDEIMAATERMEATERELAQRQEEIDAAAQHIEHLKQLKMLAEAEAKMREAQTKIQQLEVAKQEANIDILKASQDLEQLREELYEVPLQNLSGGKAAEISELQVEAYLERHSVDALMEDLLASVIQHMPSYPVPFLINLLKRKAGAALPDTDTDKAMETLRVENNELRQELERAQGETRRLESRCEQDRQDADDARRMLETARGSEGELSRTKREMLTMQEELATLNGTLATMRGTLRAEQDANATLRQTQEQFMNTQQEFMNTKQETMDLTRQLNTLKLENENLSARLEQNDATMRSTLSATESRLQMETQAQVTALQATLDRKENALATQEARVEELEQQLTRARRETLSASNASIAQLQQELDETRQALAEAEEFKTTTMTDLETQLQEAKEETSRLQQTAIVNAEQSQRLSQSQSQATRQTMNLSQVFTNAPLVYKILVRTGDVKNAGTDAKVYIQLFGADGQTDRIPLDESEGHKDKFEKSRIDTFTVEANDVGEIERVSIGHDGSGFYSGWYVDKITVRVPSLGVQYACVVDRWLARDKADGKLEVQVEVVPEEIAVQSSYVLRTYTGTKSGSSLDHAHVYVMLYGEDGKSEELQLQNHDKDNFDKKGKVDEFRLETPSVGKLSKLRVWHDNKGAFGASWYLDQVEIHDLKGDILYTFQADRWLSKNHGDKTIVAELPVSSITNSDGSVEAMDDNKVLYEVVVKTGDVRNAGTDANVFCTIYGDNGDTGDRPLKRSKNHKIDKFRRDQTDLFDLEAVDLGALSRLKIWHDNKDLMGADWYLESVTVKKEGSDDVVFPCNAWLSKNKGLVKELTPKTHDIEEFQVEKAMGVDYHIKVITSDIKEAGTDARVHIVLYGDTQDTGKIMLVKSLDHKDKFQRGQEDNFIVNAVDIGDIKKIVIGHDNKREGLLTNPSWHLNRVEVDAPALGKKFTFPADRWLAKGKDDGQLEVTLFPGAGGASDAVEEYKAKRTWEVIVTTSDIKHAGTDAAVRITVYSRNPKGESFDEDLDFESQATKDSFERGTVDHFRFDLVDHGEPYKVRVGHDDSGWGADWHCATVAMVDPKQKVRYEFPVNDWIKDKNQVEAPLGSKSSLNDANEVVEADTAVDLDSISLAQYKVKVTTGSDRGASTDANIFITMFGENGDSGERDLGKSLTNSDRFEVGKTDEFLIDKVSKLGALSRIKLRSDNRKGMHIMSPNWQVESVVITDPDDVQYKFMCNAWLSKGKGLVQEFPVMKTRQSRSSRASPAASRRMSRSAAVGSPRGSRSSLGVTSATVDVADALAQAKASTGSVKPKRNKVGYQIAVTTGTAKGAGTDANISIVLTGKNGSSGSIALAKSKTNKDKFEAGKTDVFDGGTIPDLGPLKKITLTRDTNRGAHIMRPQWLVDTVKVTASNGTSWMFTCGAWLSKKDGLSKDFAVDGGNDDVDDDEDEEFMRSAASASAHLK